MKQLIRFCSLIFAFAQLFVQSTMAQPPEILCQGAIIGSNATSATNPVPIAGCADGVGINTRQFAVTNSGLSAETISVSGGWKFRNNGIYEDFDETLPTSSLSALKSGSSATVALTNWSFSQIPATVDSMYALITVFQGVNPLATCRSEVISALVDPSSAVGNTSGNQTICTGSTPNNMSIASSTGTVQWHRANNVSFTGFQIIGTNSNTLTGTQVGPLNETTYFRARVKSGSCDAVISSTITVSVNAQSAVGAISANQVICAGSVPANISVASATGTVQWQRANNPGFTSPQNIGINSLSLTGAIIGTLNETTYFRALVTNAPCPQVISGTVTVTVNPASAVGSVSGDQATCAGTNPANMSITSSTGTVQWQRANNAAFTGAQNIGANNNLLTGVQVGPLNETTYFRAVVTNAPCASITSGTITVTISPQSAVGTVSPDQTICSGATPASMSISSSTGTVQWQRANNPSFTGAVNLGNNSNTLTGAQVNPLTETTYFRAVVTSGNCLPVTSQTITVLVRPTPNASISFQSASQVSEQTICNASSTNFFIRNLNTMAGLPATNISYAIFDSGGSAVTGGSGSVSLNNSTTSSAISNPSDLPAGIYTIEITSIAYASAPGCTNSNPSVAPITLTVLPAPSVLIAATGGTLCQLNEQEVTVTNTTAPSTPSLNINLNWNSGSQSGSISLGSGSTAEGTILLDLSNAGSTQVFEITQASFNNPGIPACTTSSPSGGSLSITVRPRPIFQTVLNADPEPGLNHLCSGYGTATVQVGANVGSIVWDGTYTLPSGEPITISNIASTVSLQNDVPGVHILEVTEVAYTNAPVCLHNPIDFPGGGNQPSRTVTIKPTPERPLLNATNLGYLQDFGAIHFCAYSSPSDSIARVGELPTLLDPESYPQGSTIRWRNWIAASNTFGNPIAFTNALESGIDYFASVISDNCESRLDAIQLFENNTYASVELIGVPNDGLSGLYPDDICSGGLSLEFNPLPGNFNDYCIWNIQNPAGLNSSINNLCGIDPSTPFNFSLTNTTDNALTWQAEFYARNVSPQVICWAASQNIEIFVNPNAIFDTEVLAYDVCSNGNNFVIDPVWNGIGEGDFSNGTFWDTSGLPLSVEINSDQSLLVLLEESNPSPGTYTIEVRGKYPESDCSDSTTFTITILPIPDFETSVLDVDGTFCHGEYTNIRAYSSNNNLTYAWECQPCEADDFESQSFLPRWLNPEPGSGGWNNLNASYSVTATDTTTEQRCANSLTVDVEIQGDYASCPEGLAWFAPNGLSVVDAPALYFQWYSVENDTIFSAIVGATDQSYFPPDNVDNCAPDRYIVATSLYPDKCWSTSLNCFENFGLRTCDGPKSAQSTEDFLVYPNPVVSGLIVLEEMKGAPEIRYNLEIHDITGKLIYFDQRYIDGRSRNNIELPHLSYGVYLLHVSNLKYSKTFKLIANN